MKQLSAFLFAQILLHHFSVALSQVVLDFETFKARVIEFHPIVRQAELKLEAGENELRKAKGALDPSISSELSGKEFEGKDYYFLSNTGLKIPTWLGIDLKAGYEANRGIYLNEQNLVPNSGLWFAGITVPLGQGLFFDERRAAIRQAQWMQRSSENERILTVNDLLLDAYSSYWSWYENYQRLKIAAEGLDFAEQRFEGIRQNAFLGDIPFIDTLEALIQLDNRKIEFSQAEYDFRNASLILETFMWSDDWIPLELEPTTIPDTFSYLPVNLDEQRFNVGTDLENLPPQVLNAAYKLEQLKIEERWKKEKLKPVFDVQYNALVQPYGTSQLSSFNENNYKWGVSVYFPLFLRKERGELKLTQVKIESGKLDITMKVREMKLKEESLRNELIQYYAQLEIQRNQVLNAQRLRDGEQVKLSIGESSLFLMNSREVSYLGSRVKLANLEAKVKILESKWFWLGSELFR